MATKTAPDLTPNYPSRGEKLGPAWTALWAELQRVKRRKDPFLEGRALAEQIAPDHGLMSATLVALLSRAAQAGLLEREVRPVEGERGPRPRTHYRIPGL